MSERIFPPLSSVNSPSGVQPGIPINRQPVPDSAGGGFKQILNEKLLPELKISAHAQKRMQDRGITLSPTELAGIKEAVGKAQAKGCRDSLVVLDRMAFIVSVENQTVVTAVDRQSLKENVFTNIDSAVFVTR
ncbi:MAG TPA: flagellar protein [Firmicutes bacterium]|nr:flagellar protein [Bacillota bacterium]